ncbi:MAG TPA: transposase [Cyclobacteriaceae bacterium]|nr:transposase [Cyclobacteriaceae bacterium]
MGLSGRNQFLDEECFFVTTTCYNWYNLLEMDSCKHTVSESINFLNNKYFAATLGYVIMPNHIHLILYFKKGNQLSNWMRDLKKFTSTKVRQQIEKSGNIDLLEKLRVPEKKQVFKVWQDRFDDVYLANKKLLETKLEYIHTNPLQENWNLVSKPEDWLCSSAMFYEFGKQLVVIITDYREYF